MVVRRAKQVPQPGDDFMVSTGTESMIIVYDRQGQVNSFYNVWTKFISDPFERISLDSAF